MCAHTLGLIFVCTHRFEGSGGERFGIQVAEWSTLALDVCITCLVLGKVSELWRPSLVQLIVMLACHLVRWQPE